MKYYQENVATIIKKFSSNEIQGLHDETVAQNISKFGENKLPEKENDPYWKLFLKSFKEPIVIVLLGAVTLSFLSSFYAFKIKNDVLHGKEALYEAIAILILILINSFLSLWQEVTAQKKLDALKEMNNHSTTVLRNGRWKKILAHDLVAGDIIKVEMGDFIEADVRWIEADELQVVEAHLTGESDSILKDTNTIEEDVPLGDQLNMGFSGSTVSNGRGIGIVTAVGKSTELGNIAELIQSADSKKSPLQQMVIKLTKVLMGVSAGIVLLSFIIGIIHAGGFNIDSFIPILSTSIALAVASIPDALPAVLSIVLTIGATKLAKNKGLIKSLNSVETLGSTSYVCSDKTGTLTKNEMTAVKYYANGNFYEVSGLGYTADGGISLVEGDNKNTDEIFLNGAVLCNESEIKESNGSFQVFGNPTEIALNILGRKAGYKKETLLKDVEIVRTLPFTSARKMMSVVVKKGENYLLYTKGAPDVVIKNSKGILKNNNILDISEEKDNFNKITENYAKKALRTLAVSYKEIPEEEAMNADIEELEKNLIITGVAGIIDPAREEVKDSVKDLQNAHISVVMITGDHEATARAIAYDLGIIKDKKAPVITGATIEKLSDQELFNKVLETNIYARVSPEHKQRIVKQLQRHGQVVAMTGDGVNDAPALKVADIGIAMGITGTEVTKDTADLILLDDKFTTIEKSVLSGRTIYANIKNFMRHELTTNVAEVLSLLLGLVFFTKTIGNVPGATPTLTALMVLWVNMVSDAIPSFSLAYDVAESNIMLDKPRDPNESVLANYTWSRVLIRGLVMGVMVYAAFILAAQFGLSSNQAQTVAFLTLVYGQLWHIFDARSSKSLFRRNPFSNKKLIVSVAFAAVASFLVTVIPFFNMVMGTEQLPTIAYVLVILIPALPTLLLSGIKELFNIKIW